MTSPQAVLAAEAVTSPGWSTVAASLSLVAVALGLSAWARLGLGRETLVASVRAAVQLLAVGALFLVIFRSPRSTAWAWLWVLGMVMMATVVVVRRAKVPIPGLPVAVAAAVALSTLLSVGIAFGTGVFGFDAVTLVVMAGITIGNALPSAVLAVQQTVALVRDGPGQLEALLALGFDRVGAARFVAPRAAHAALTPQIERTKVVGLIALPGALTGLLLAGVEPVQAVVVQLLVMYLVLGSAAVAVVTVVSIVSRAVVTSDLRLAEWVRSH